MWYDARMTEDEHDKFLRSYVLCGSCWLWAKSLAGGGYGQCTIGGRSRRAHRVCYEMVYDVVLTPDQFLHHLCKNKTCVNPMHMEITNQLDHVDSAIFGNKGKTHCPHGHEYTPENTCWNRGGTSRECRICKYARIRRRSQRIRQQAMEQVSVRLKELALKCQNR